MADFDASEDEAALYVLGELNAAERREFEERLAQSAELRALVRELEEGAVALAHASPRRRPPAQLWTRIEQAIGRQARRRIVSAVFWTGWWRNGWAAAAACLAGWLLYALWTPRPAPTNASPGPDASADRGQPGTTLADPRSRPHDEARQSAPAPGREADAALQVLRANTQQLATLRWQIVGLTNRVGQLSRALAQHQALLAEPARLKFFLLGAPSGGGAAVKTLPISPELQQALVLALARELGWAPTDAPSETGTAEPARTNQTSVDFVDLRPGSNSVPASVGPPRVEAEPAPATLPPDSLAAASPSTNAIPGFLSGTNAVLAFDSTVVPTGSSLTFLAMTASGQFQSLGTTVLGNNPTVVTVPFGDPLGAGGNVTVIAGTAGGMSNVIGQFIVQGTLSP